MTEFLDFGRYTPYIFASYGASILLIGALIYQRRAKLNKARDAELRNKADTAE